MPEIAWEIVQAQAIAEALHYSCYESIKKLSPRHVMEEEEYGKPLPNSPGYQSLWKAFIQDAGIAILALKGQL